MAEKVEPPSTTITVPKQIVVRPWAKRLIVWCLSFSGFILSCVAVGSCRFIQRISASDDNTVSIEYFGLFQILVGSTCVTFDGLPFYLSDDPSTQDSFSSSEKAARAFGVLTALLSGVAVFAQISTCCIKMKQKNWYAVGVALAICVMFQSFTFILFNSPRCKDTSEFIPTKCNLDEGGAASVVAMLFYIVSSVGIFLVPAPSGEPLFDCSSLALTYSQEPLRTVTEVINSDGSKTVFVTSTTAPNVPYSEETQKESSSPPKAQIENDEENPSSEIQETEKNETIVEEKFEKNNINAHDTDLEAKNEDDSTRQNEESREPSEKEETENTDKFCDDGCDDTPKIHSPIEENKETENIKVVAL